MSLLSRLLDAGHLSPLSVSFARFIARQGQHEEDSVVSLSAAIVSECNQRGDVCIELAALAGKPLFSSVVTGPIADMPPLSEWCAQLRDSVCVASPGEVAPLVLDGSRLYLQRFWQYENTVHTGIVARLATAVDIDESRLQHGLARVFPEAPNATEANWQKLATALAVSRQFAVISGGPGTGKTTTAVKLLALLLEQHPQARIRLAAPTGKAAARMVESLRAARDRLALDPAIAARLPDSASTLHRLLGYQRTEAGWRFRHHAHNPLLLDCLLLDEASMIDLPLMSALVEACPPTTRLILLGDRDQLASVEAGNVLGDITGHGQALHYRPEAVALLQRLCPTQTQAIPTDPLAPAIADAIALLRTSYRFDAHSRIGRLARAVNAAQVPEALALLEEGAGPGNQELTWLTPTASVHQPLNPAVIAWALSHYRAYLGCRDVAQALAAFAASRVLCAAHEGPVGEREVNARVAQSLMEAGLMTEPTGGHGTPVMITVNDYETGLFNGDIGLLWRSAEGALEACFPGEAGEIRRIPAGSLPEHLPAWAMTVHKSQGSEFDAVMLVLPADENSPLLLRELLYTGITRARQHLSLHGSKTALARACVTPVRRSSGLAARLGWASPEA